MSIVKRITKNTFVKSLDISQFEQIVGKEAFNNLIEVYNEIVLKNKNSDVITELLKIFFSAGYIKGKQDLVDMLS